MSACDPKRTCAGCFAAMQDPDLLYSIRDPCPWGKAHEAARFHLPSGEEISKMLDHDRQEAKSFGPRVAHRDSGIGDDAHRVAQPGCQRESARRRLARLPAATAFTLKLR